MLEFLYKGDYYPRMEYDRRRRSYMLENAADPSSRASTVESTVWVEGVETVVLKDTVIYVSVTPFPQFPLPLYSCPTTPRNNTH